jgi:Flp pilus assembly protein TadG
MKRNRNQRNGIAAVEFAVVLPVMALLVLGTIEASRALSVQHTLQEASMHGCRVYMLSNKTQADAANVINQSLAAASISGHTITYDPPTKAGIDTEMEPVTVTISVPYSNVSYGVEWFLQSSTLSAASVLPADLLEAPTPSSEDDD